MTIKLIGGNLTERNGEIIALGWLDMENAGKLKIDDYQREVLKPTSGKSKIFKAVARGVRLPTIVIGLRGKTYHNSGKDMLLDDAAYIVDGLQRIAACREFCDERPDEPEPMIAAEIRFGTNKQSEKQLFHDLNLHRTRMAPSVILRNMRDKYSSIASLYGLSRSDRASPMYGRVSWDQRMKRGELLTALGFAKTVELLFSHAIVDSKKKPMKTEWGGPEITATRLQQIVETVGLKHFRETALTFFQAVNATWGIVSIEYSQKATYLRGNFLSVLAIMFSQHEVFWRDNNELFISADTRRKLKSFPIDDPEVVRLAASGRMAVPLLYTLLLAHFNKGKSKNRLVPRPERE